LGRSSTPCAGALKKAENNIATFFAGELRVGGEVGETEAVAKGAGNYVAEYTLCILRLQFPFEAPIALILKM
jgi:hypothetical protein